MLGDNIRKYRKFNQMSQDELAEQLGVTRQSISLWENGQTQPSLDNIVALASLFGISTDNLLMDSEPASAPAVAANAVAERSYEYATELAPMPPKKKSYIWVICLSVIAVLVAAIVLWQCGVFSSDSDDEPKAGDVAGKEEAPDMDDLYEYLKEFVIENGTINGDYCYISEPADLYGGLNADDFSLYYWGDTGTIEFCLHRVIDDTFSINFYLLIPETYTGKYEYISSYYYRDSGEPYYEARGTITAKEFTESYPLNCSKYTGDKEQQNDFMELSRLGICEMLSCLKEFLKVEKLDYSFKDLGFTKF